MARKKIGGINTFRRIFPISQDAIYKAREYDPRSPYVPKGQYISCENISAASNLALADTMCNIFHVVGTTTINSISSANTISGRIIYLLFNNSITIKDGFNLSLVSDFSATIGDTLCLVCDGTYWYELSRSVTASYNWVKTSLGKADWYSCACSSDGYNMIACGETEIPFSNDSGSSWDDGGLSKNWCACDTEENGTILIGLEDRGRVYRSVNGGWDWNEVQPVGNVDREWTDCASSIYGEHMIVVNQDGGVYTSTDYGVNWTSRSLGAYYWKSCDISSNGNVMIVCSDGCVSKSTNGGVNWTTITPSGGAALTSCALAADSSNRFILCGYYKLYTSTDGGVNWTTRTIPGGGYWNSCASCGTGANLIAVSSYRIFVSHNSGVNWTTELPLGYSASNFRSCAIANNGKKLMACTKEVSGSTGYVYVGTKK